MSKKNTKEKFTLEQEFMLNRALQASYTKGDAWYWNFIDRFLIAFESHDTQQLQELEAESYTWH